MIKTDKTYVRAFENQIRDNLKMFPIPKQFSDNCQGISEELEELSKNWNTDNSPTEIKRLNNIKEELEIITEDVIKSINELRSSSLLLTEFEQIVTDSYISG